MSFSLIITYGFLGFLATVGFIFLIVRFLQYTICRTPPENIRLVAIAPVSRGDGGRIADEIWQYRFFFDQNRVSDGFLLLVGDNLDEGSLQCCHILSRSYPWIGFCSTEEFERYCSQIQAAGVSRSF